MAIKPTIKKTIEKNRTHILNSVTLFPNKLLLKKALSKIIPIRIEPPDEIKGCLLQNQFNFLNKEGLKCLL